MSKQKSKKSKKGIIFLIMILLVIVGVSSLYFINTSKVSAASKTISTPTKTMTLAKNDLVESLSTSGTIYSGNTEKVYTTLSYPVKEVNVKVGDVVKKGDVLAILDDSTLKHDIEQAEINLANAIKSSTETTFTLKNNIDSANISVSSSNISLEKQQINYDLLKSQLDNKTSSELVSAQNNIDSSKLAIDTEKQNMDAANLSVDSAKLELDSTKNDLDSKSLDYENNKLLFESGAISKTDLDTLQRTLENSNVSYEKSNVSYEKSKSTYENSIASYENSKSDYDKALANYTRVEEKLKNDLILLKKDIESSKLSNKKSENELTAAKEKATTNTSSVSSQQISLSKLTDQLDKIEIKSTINGTVTAVNTVVDSTPKDILFEIQDFDSLYVSTNIKELKIGKVSKSQDVLITTQATDNKILKGTVDFISQTATDSSTASDVEYEAKINMIDTDPNLKIGMNAFLNIILQSKKDIYSVPYDAIVYSRGKGSSLYALVNNIVTEIPVTTGMENDTLTEISGDGITDGVTIITNPTTVTLGQTIDSKTLTENSGNRNSQPSGSTNNAVGAPNNFGGERPPVSGN